MGKKQSTDGVVRDKWGRYLLPPVDNPHGEREPYQRVTTFARLISDTYGLQTWSERMVAKGMAMRPDLVHLAVDDNRLDDVVEQAKSAACADAAANIGSAIHAVLAKYDLGEQVPKEYQDVAKAYRDALGQLKLETDPRYVERVCVLPKYKLAGTFDRIVRRGSQMYICDLKTGKQLKYSMGEIAVQLVAYAHATHIWEEAAKSYSLMPNVDNSIAFVVHLPEGRAEAAVYCVDLYGAIDGARLCRQVKAWREKCADLATRII